MFTKIKNTFFLFKILEKDNTCKCRDGEYRSSNTCVDCPTECTTCESATVCQGCIDSYY